MDDSATVWLKFISYVFDKWNIFDIITIVTYIMGLVLRCIPIAVCDRCFYAARIIFAFNHMLFSFRILNLFSVHEQLGPKLIMIGKMVRFFRATVYMLSAHMYRNSVRLSVCPSVTLVIHAKTVEVRIMQFSTYSSLYSFCGISFIQKF